ncbi:MAG TPA: GTPase HflX [Candidatus Omnitrophica bacterium]|nr:GTPase HflX [Candidatus Omnitrophota bacterium]
MAIEKVVLVLVELTTRKGFLIDEELEEMVELIRSANGDVVAAVQVKLFRPNASLFIGAGKVEEIAQQLLETGARRVVFNQNLSPVQTRNLEMQLKKHKAKVIDRNLLILDIFARRAKSSDGKLQVELAQLEYQLPRVDMQWEKLSRAAGGGAGAMGGQGEQQIEIDRRRIRERIIRVKKELLKLKEHRARLRAGRKQKQFVQAVLVGYTNAGKSTLLNALTGAEAYAMDQLFATLDPKTRLFQDGRIGSILVTDTVGFIRDLPHHLVEAFHATLEEVTEADAVIHVIDVSNPNTLEQVKVVEKVLASLKASEKPTIFALNKSDLLTPEQKKMWLSEFPDSICISAKKKEGLRELMQKVKDVLAEYNRQTRASKSA